MEIIRELQERALEREAKWRLKLTRYIKRHEVEMAKVKKTQQATTVGMFSLVYVMMNMTAQTMNDDSVGDIEDCDELDLRSSVGCLVLFQYLVYCWFFQSFVAQLPGACVRIKPKNVFNNVTLIYVGYVMLV